MIYYFVCDQPSFYSVDTKYVLNKKSQEELSFIEEFCEKKVVIQKNDGHFFEGILTGYDMYHVYLLRDDGTEKILHCDIEGVKVIEEGK